MRTKDRRKAIRLRREGKTYSEIRKKLDIPKSTLSEWLNNYPLSNKQIQNLQVNVRKSREKAAEKTIVTKRQKKLERIKIIEKKEKKALLPLNKREFYIAGLFLYLGEGRKGDNSTVSLNNTDPRVVKMFYYWLVYVLEVRKERIRVAVHIYEDMNIEKSLNYWSNYLHIQRKQFVKPYIKHSLRQEVDQKGYGYGTCGLYVYDRQLKLKILAGIDVIASKIVRMV